MSWNLEEALHYYKTQGAPRDQAAVISLLKELQQENGGKIPGWMITRAAEFYATKEGYFLAYIKRVPSLRLENTHCLELCAGPNCSNRGALAAFVEKTYGTKNFELRYCGCMRQCGQGPNLRWDGKVYNHADEALIRRLVEEAER